VKEKHYQYSLDNGDLVIIDVRLVPDSKYRGGVMFTFRCMSQKGETRFAVENSHGEPHIHAKGRKEPLDCDWKAAHRKFDEMLGEHIRKIGKGL